MTSVVETKCIFAANAINTNRQEKGYGVFTLALLDQLYLQNGPKSKFLPNYK